MNNTWFVGTAVRQVAFSAGGKLIGALAEYTGYNGISTLGLWDAASGHPAEAARWGGIYAKAKWNCFAVEPRGQRVATGGGEMIKAESATDPPVAGDTRRIATVTLWAPEQIEMQNRSGGE